MKKLCIVIPCYNEEEVLNETAKRVTQKLDKLITKKIITSNSSILFVDDGSKDKTWKLISSLAKDNKLIKGLKLSRNKGHQNALYAGLMTAKEENDLIISMDADLQDDINAIDQMLIKANEGNEIVYGVRNSRKKDSFFKKYTALMFYKIMKFLGVDIIYNHADYRLATKRVLDNLEKFDEVNLFLRGIFPLIGYKYEMVYYDRDKRFAGETKYPLKKMLALAWNGITSFSIKPIKFIRNFGILFIITSLIAIIILLILKELTNLILIILIMTNLTGIVLLALGIVGEYIGKIHEEIKHRPKYFIEEYLK